ncbi:MAG: transposase [Gemmatimonadales bacterium]|nr:transposase [Gemmatimonadales bacterium]
MRGAASHTYPSEFKRRIVELVRAGRSLEELAEESGPSVQAISVWRQRCRLASLLG